MLIKAYKPLSEVNQYEEVEQLKIENDKLRELVQSMYETTLIRCSECWVRCLNPAKCYNEFCSNRKNYLAMRELGIEVDG